jgi:hypothetical protein
MLPISREIVWNFIKTVYSDREQAEAVFVFANIEDLLAADLYRALAS